MKTIVMETAIRTSILIALCYLLAGCEEHTSDMPPVHIEEQQSAAVAQQQQNLWTADVSGKVAFQSDRDGDWEIFIMNIDGSNLVQLTHNQAADEYPVWSPDGSQIAFQSNRDGSYDIYLMNADGTDQRKLTNHPANERDPAWSPDGFQIAFDSDRASNQELYIINADGSAETSLTETIGRNILPAWSPDGSRMAYTGNRYLGWNVYVMNRDTSEDSRITDGHGACRPDWSPDGTKIAYVSQKADGKGDIWIMDPDGSEKQQLTVDAENYDYYPDWSPDGHYLLYAKTPDKKRGNWEIFVMTADGQQHAQLTHHPARDEFPNWHDGTVPDDLFRQQSFVYEAEKLPRQVGEVQNDPQASEGRAVIAQETGKSGFIVYGPYHEFQAADYVVNFRLKTDRTDVQESVVVIDVTTETGATVLAKKEIFGTDFEQSNVYQEFQLPFSLSDVRTLEFRVYAPGNAEIMVDQISVSPQ